MARGTYQRPAWLADWISITSDGRYSYYEGFAVGAGKRIQLRGGSIEGAEAKARELMKSAGRAAGLNVALGATWADLCQGWVNAHDERIPEGTMKRRLSAINAWIVPTVGHVRVEDTSLATMLAVADAVAAKTGQSNFDAVTQTMSVVGEWAMERQYLPEGALGTRDGRRRALKKARDLTVNHKRRCADDGDSDRGIKLEQVPTWADVVRFSDAVADRGGALARSRQVGEQLGRLVRIEAGTGLRMCEALGLEVQSIDFELGVILVDRQIDRYTPWDGTGPMPTCPPKHGRARKARIWDKVGEDLENAVAFAIDGVLFPPTRQQAWWPDAWGRLLEAVRADIDWAWPPHWLRHHYGSYSLAPREAGGYGLPSVEVQVSMGHTKLSTTLDTYIQRTDDNQGWIR